METCLRYNIFGFKTYSQPVFHLYSSNFSLQIIVATHSMSAVLGTSGIPLSMTALKQQQHIQNHRLWKAYWSITSLFNVHFKTVSLRFEAWTLERRWSYFRLICSVQSHFLLLETEIILVCTSKVVLLKYCVLPDRTCSPFPRNTVSSLPLENRDQLMS